MKKYFCICSIICLFTICCINRHILDNNLNYIPLGKISELHTNRWVYIEKSDLTTFFRPVDKKVEFKETLSKNNSELFRVGNRPKTFIASISKFGNLAISGSSEPVLVSDYSIHQRQIARAIQLTLNL